MWIFYVVMSELRVFRVFGGDLMKYRQLTL